MGKRRGTSQGHGRRATQVGAAPGAREATAGVGSGAGARAGASPRPASRDVPRAPADVLAPPVGAGALGGLDAVAAPPLLRPLVVDARSLGLVVVVAAVAWGAWIARDVLVTLLFAGVLTFLGGPVVRRLEARRVPRAAAAALFLLGAIGAVFALLALVVPTLVAELVQLFEKLPAAFARAVSWFEATTGRHLPRSISELTGAASTELVQRLSSLASSSGGAVGKGALGVLSGAFGALGFVAQAFLVPVLAFFLLVEVEAVRAFVLLLLPAGVRARAVAVGPHVDRALSGLVRGQLTVAGIMALIYVLGLSIAGVPLAVAIGILSGVAYLVPFASPAVCVVLSTTFSLLELGAGALVPIVGAIVTAVVVQLVEGWVLTPRIVGDSAGLSPLAAILAVLFGGALFGFLGVLFALPVAAALAVVLKEEMRRRGLALDAEGAA